MKIYISFAEQDPDERIYIIASYAPYARELLCEVRPLETTCACLHRSYID